MEIEFSKPKSEMYLKAAYRKRRVIFEISVQKTLSDKCSICPNQNFLNIELSKNAVKNPSKNA